MMKGMERKGVSNVNAVGSYILAASITLIEEGLDEHDVYATIVSLIGDTLREPEEEPEEETEEEDEAANE